MITRQIHTRIIETLTPLKTEKKIKEVWGYGVEKIDGFPFLEVEVANGEEDFQSTCSNNETLYYSILVFDDLTSKKDTKQAVDYRMMDLSDEIKNLLRKSGFEDLGGYLPIAKTGGFKYLKRETGTVRVFEVKFQVQHKPQRN